LKAIIACDPYGGIGYHGTLPWKKLDGDLPRFKKLTAYGTVIMGRNTWDSLPKKPLPNRLNVIVTSKFIELNSNLPKGSIAIPNLDHIKPDDIKNSWLIGGAQLLKSVWHLVDEIHLSRTYAKYSCSVFIDVVQLVSDFMLISILRYEDHTYEVWKRR
jgi:dihydrofolate reductase